jgi:hypothetical protein
VLVYERHKGVVMVSHEEMREFMNNDILKAIARLLRQLQIDPHPVSLGLQGPHFVFIFLIPNVVTWRKTVRLSASSL